MLIGANWPEDPKDRDAPEETWRIFDLMNPRQVRIKSNTSERDVRLLAQTFPGMLWHIKMKGNKKWFPSDIYAKEYPDEMNPIELIRLLMSLGVHPVLELLNEVDIELTPEWQADNTEHRSTAIVSYCNWAHTQLDILNSVFGSPGPTTYHVAVSSLSEGGPPDRFENWWQAFISSGLLSRVTRVVEHNYFPSFQYDSLDWGSRYKRVRQDWKGPIDITETNDGGDLDAAVRAIAFKQYVEYLIQQNDVASVSLFLLPGSGFGTPDWWSISSDTAIAVGELQEIISTPPIPPTPPMPPRLNAWEYWSADTIASVAGVPLGNVIRFWPTIHEALSAHNIADKAVQAAAIGTIAIETASTFAPIDEFWSTYWDGYSGGPTFHGRGFIQLTHDYNYQAIGDMLGFDLISDPNMAKDPFVAAMVLARYFANPRMSDGLSVADVARGRDWASVRRKVQGGTAGLDRLMRCANQLLGVSPILPKYGFPVAGYTGEVNLHWGTHIGASDLFAPLGSDVVIMTRGTITNSGFNNIGGYNILYRGDDGLDYYYAHGDREPQVERGQRVDVGQYVFGVGTSGNAAGGAAHLHIGIGYTIISGTGPQGGAGANFDAVTFLRNILGTIIVEDDPMRVAELEGIIAELQHQLTGKDDYTSGVVEGFAHVADVIVPQIVESKQMKKRRELGKQIAEIRTERIGPKPS